MSDGLIVDTAVRMYREFGFRGLVGWHYYNEPLCEMARMLSLMSAICDRVHEARFVLWSNGMLLPMVQDGFEYFEQAHLTDYGGLSKPRVSKLRERCPHVMVHRWPLDDRLTADSGPLRYEPCGRMFTEFILDYYGNVHLCCFDWMGLGLPGNIHTTPFDWMGLGLPGNIHTTPIDELVRRWQAIRQGVSGDQMDAAAPQTCLRCTKRNAAVPNFEPTIAADARTADVRTLAAATSEPLSVAVVFPHYRMPRSRLLDHFGWNVDIYNTKGVVVYVVADEMQESPSSFIGFVIVPESRLPLLDGRHIFSIAATKNRGIRSALADGCDIIIVTDSCIAFSPETWQRMCRVRLGEAIVPYYRMATTFEDRNAAEPPDIGMTGTIAMRAADWKGVRFNERCKGYGAEDGQIIQAIKQKRIKIKREGIVWHIAHDPAAPQVNVPGHGRADCWNRKSGFNPDNFLKNRRAGR
jgi:hypothetical protein